MSSPTHLTALSPLVEMLVEASDARERDRLLLDAPLFLSVARAASLWRESPTQEEGWQRVIARGEEELLPGIDQLQAVAAGALDGELPGGRRVLVAGVRGRRAALALGGVLSEEDQIDLLEALLLTFTTLEEANRPRQVTPELLDQVSPLLPSEDKGIRWRRLTHDLRNHMASIRATQELLLRHGKGMDEVEREHFHSILEHEVRRARGLLIHTTHGPEPNLPLESGLLATLLGEIVDAERIACEGEAVELELVVDEAAQDALSPIDELSLSRVVQNLLVNAREAIANSGTAGRIEVRLEKRGRELALFVQDDGPGIAEADLESIWSDGYSGKGPDRGYGLAVVRELIEASRAHIAVQRRAPRGTCFTIAWSPIDADP